MAYEWHAPSRGVVLNTAGSIAGLITTRNDFIGWGPSVADFFRNASEHPDAVIALAVGVAALAYLHWRTILHLVGFREKKGPRWGNDSQISTAIYDWIKPTATVTDRTSDYLNKSPGLSFSLLIGGSRPVVITKRADVPAIQFSSRVTPSEVHRQTIATMNDGDVRVMQDEISMELVKLGIPIVIAERIIPGRGPEKDADGDDIPEGVFFADILPVDTLTQELLITEINRVRIGVAMTQVLVRKHVRMEDLRQGRAASPVEVAAGLTVVPPASTDGGDERSAAS